MKNLLISCLALFILFTNFSKTQGQNGNRVDTYNCMDAIRERSGNCTKVGSVLISVYFTRSPTRTPRDSCGNSCYIDIIYANRINADTNPQLSITSIVISDQSPTEIKAKFGNSDLSLKTPLDVRTNTDVNSETRGFAQLVGEENTSVKNLRQIQLCDSKTCRF